MTENEMILRLESRLEDLEQLEPMLLDLATRFGISDADRMSINLVLEELLTNVIEHGHPEAGEHEIVLRISVSKGDLKMAVEDDGRPFSPLEAPKPDLGAPLQDRPIGGLGLHLVRAMVDELEYERTEGKNVTTVVKRAVVRESA